MQSYYVYMLSSKTKRLYTGVVNHLERRVYEHRNKLAPGFTGKYNIDQLIYFEETLNVEAAILREKEIKGWMRNRKIALILSLIPTWTDLSEDGC